MQARTRVFERAGERRPAPTNRTCTGCSLRRTRMRTCALVTLLSCLLGTTSARAAETGPEKGTVHFRPISDQANIPERYRLERHDFEFALTLHRQLWNSGVTVYRLQFPSAVTTPCQENNTVHAEYYRP